MKKALNLFFFCFLFLIPVLASGTLYDVLGVSKDFSPEELETAYKRMRGAFHPDRNKAPNAEDKFNEIQDAYDILKNPDLRPKYDSWIATYEYKNQFNKGSQSQTEDHNSKSNKNFKDSFLSELHLAILTEKEMNDEGLQVREKATLKMVRVILKRPTDLEAQNILGETPFLMAVREGMLSTAYLLLDKGADPEISDYAGNNAVHKFILEGSNKHYYRNDFGIDYSKTNRKNSQKLIGLHTVIMAKNKGGANLLNSRNKDGRTPLFLAIQENLVGAVKWFILHGAELTEKERNFLSQEAVVEGRIQMVSILKNLPSKKLPSNKPSDKSRFRKFFNLCENVFN